MNNRAPLYANDIKDMTTIIRMIQIRFMLKKTGLNVAYSLSISNIFVIYKI